MRGQPSASCAPSYDSASKLWTFVSLSVEKVNLILEVPTSSIEEVSRREEKRSTTLGCGQENVPFSISAEIRTPNFASLDVSSEFRCHCQASA